ncbi:hypothetical protein AB6A40_010702 [Gnathostoma spinigerum]|uniref:uridine/cytidine kinase n=1 Tax=Gnathostoma spinigerum TaxID=75299 RepID=A0ABD6EVM7_9BILA
MEDGEERIKLPFIIGVAGGSASGKSTVCSRIIERLGKQHKRRVVAISQNCFYRDLSDEEAKWAARGEFNFDHPSAFDHKRLIAVLRKLEKGESVQIQRYDFKTNSRMTTFEMIEPADVIIVEGILIFYNQRLREMFDMKLFVDADSDDRLACRVRRDTKERGRPLDQVLSQYLRLVKPAFEDFCLPTKKYADIVIPRGANNEVAIGLILHHIHDILNTPHSSSRSSVEESMFKESPIYKSAH